MTEPASAIELSFEDLTDCDYRNIPIDTAATNGVIKQYAIGPGDEIFMTGLFSQHYGKERNLPIVRCGNLALISEEKIYTKSLGEIDAYLIEARSIGGLSGSPVFVNLGVYRSVSVTKVGDQVKSFSWLGLMHGHWEIDETKIDTIDAPDKVNMGIGIVVPAIKIVELIEREFD